MKIIFLAELIITIIVSVIFMKNITKVTAEEVTDEKDGESEKKPKRNLSKKEIFADFFTVLMLIIGLTDITHLADFGEFQGGFAVMGALLALEKAVNVIRRRATSRTLEFLGKALLAVAVIELTVFQFPSYRMFFGNFTRREIPISELQRVIPATDESEEYTEAYGRDDILVEGGEKLSLIADNINMKVGTLHFIITDASDEPRNKLSISVDATDETYSHHYRDSVIKTESYFGDEDSQYTTVLLSGKTGGMRFNFTQTYNDRFFTISSIELNAPVPFDVSAVRMIILTVVSTLAYAVVFSALLKKSYGENRFVCNTSAVLLTALAVMLAAAIVIVKIPADSEDYFKQESGNQVSEELVLAFENGQVSLLHEPTPELYNIENPYDRSIRETTDINDSFQSIWDHVLYNEKLYSYYGIAPVILLFLPYHMITGYFFPTDIAVMIFAIIGIIFLTLAYTEVIKRWFSRIPSGCYIAGLIIILASCGIWYSTGRTLFYEIAISSGFAFTTMGAYFLISSKVIGKGKTSLVRVFLASLFLAIAVLCRPTLAVYSVCACVYYLMGFRKSAEIPDPTAESGVKTVKNRKIIYAVCALLPFVVLGSAQMWYNYARFESPFNFGIEYSLTINDFVNAQYHTLFVIIGTFAYLFSAPQFKMCYPYVTTAFDTFDVNGFYFKDLGNTSGIAFLALPVFAYLLTGKALKKIPDRKDRLRTLVTIGLPCVVMPLVIMFSIWESGYAVRYTADFSWQIVIGALAVAFFLYINSENQLIKKLFRGFMSFSMVWAIIVNVPQIFSFVFNSHDYYPNVIEDFKQLVQFWY